MSIQSGVDFTSERSRSLSVGEGGDCEWSLEQSVITLSPSYTAKCTPVCTSLFFILPSFDMEMGNHFHFRSESHNRMTPGDNSFFFALQGIWWKCSLMFSYVHRSADSPIRLRAYVRQVSVFSNVTLCSSIRNYISQSLCGIRVYVLKGTRINPYRVKIHRPCRPSIPHPVWIQFYEISVGFLIKHTNLSCRQKKFHFDCLLFVRNGG